LNLGITSPVRYTLHLNCIKLKINQPLGNKKLQFRIKAMNETKSFDISNDNKLQTIAKSPKKGDNDGF